MSHVEVRQAEVKDTEALKRACSRLGWTFREGQTTFRWYGEFLGDSDKWREWFTAEQLAELDALPDEERNRRVTAEFSRCDHAIAVPGCEYEVGVVKRGDRYELLYDTFYAGGLHEVFGVEGNDPLLQAYAASVVEMECEKQGLSWSERALENGEVEVTVEVWG